VRTALKQGKHVVKMSLQHPYTDCFTCIEMPMSCELVCGEGSELALDLAGADRLRCSPLWRHSRLFQMEPRVADLSALAHPSSLRQVIVAQTKDGRQRM
jgi:hypothetical protein